MDDGVTGGPRWLGDWTALGAIALMWGTAFAVIRFAVESVPPVQVAAGRILIAAVALGAVLRGLGFRLPAPGRIWLHFLVLGVLGNALPFFLISWGQQHVASGVAGILMGTNPLVTLVLANFLARRERLTAFRLAGFALGFGGIVALVGPGALAALGADLAGQGAVLAGALCYALNAILTQRLPPMHPLVSSTCVLMVASAVIVPVALLAPGTQTVPSGAAALAVVWLGLVPTAIATVLYFRVVASAGPTFFSLVNYPVPVIAVLTGALVYAERPGPSVLLALALILAGIALAQLGTRPRRPETIPRWRP